MLDPQTKKGIDSARQILVGKVPDPKAQVEQITTALIYKFMDDMDRENVELGGEARFFVGDLKDYSWGRLLSKELSGQERLDLFVRALSLLSESKQIPPLFREIFKDAFLPYRDPETLNLFLKELNGFTYENSENLGNAFEYLLSVLGSQGDAGQFRTPRHIIDFIVEVIDPKKTEKILDPACGTAGFLISAYKHIKHVCSSNFKPEEYIPTFAETDSRDITTIEIQKNGKYKGDLLTPDDRKKLAKNIVGYDISPDMVRLSLVNLYLHGFNSPQIFEYDSLTYEDRWDETFDVILANPPFMTPKGGIRPHKRFQIQANRAEVLFVDYIMEHLKPKGRAGVIVPEGIVFQSSVAYKALRRVMVDDGYLWAVLSLPSGVFNPYSGVKTSILFFDKDLAKKSDEILFIKVEDDGFDLGAQRRRIDKNDLPIAFEIIKKFEKFLRGEDGSISYGDLKSIAHTVKKERIAESGDYNLNGDRYKKEILTALRESAIQIEEHLQPYQDMFSLLIKQAEKYQNQIKEIQNSIQPFIRYITEQQETIDEVYNYLSKPVQEISRAWKKFDFGKILESVQQLEGSIKKASWPMVELGDENFFKIESGGTPDSTNARYWNGDVSWATLADLPPTDFVTEVKNTERKITQDGLKNSSAKLLPERTVIVSTRATIGRIGIASTPIATNQGFKNVVIKDFSKVNEKFIAYAIRQLVPEMLKQASGGTFKEISKALFSKLKIPLPPIDVQRQIVKEIEAHQCVIDGAKQILNNWQVNIKINPKWEMLPIGDLCEVNPKKSEVNDFPPSTEVSFVPMECVNEHELLFVPKEDRKLGDVYKGYTYFKEGDVILAKVTPCFENGKSGVARNLTNGIGFGSSEFFVIRPNDRILPEIIYYAISAPNFIKEGSQHMTGTGGLKRLPREFLESYQIFLPSIEEQEEIVATVEAERRTLAALKELIKSYEMKIDEKFRELWSN